MLDRLPVGFGCSAGLVRWDGLEGPDQLLERADRELYAAKAGGQRCSVAEPGDVTASHPPAWD